MTRTLIRPVVQIRNSDTYDSTVAPSLANFETLPENLEVDLNNLRSMLSQLRDIQTGNWYDTLEAPTSFENGAARGVQNNNQDLHDLERKRFLARVLNVDQDIVAGAGAQGVILGASELPADTVAAIGAVITLGTVVAQASSFGVFSASDLVSGPNPLQPKNLVRLLDGSTGEPLSDSSGNEILGLLQSESGVDGHTITAIAGARVQISFVKHNADNDGLELAAAGALNSRPFDYAAIERKALQDVQEESFLNEHIGGSGTVPATAIGQVLFTVDGTAFAAEQPLTSDQGWLVNNQGILLVTG